jgi:hypothetical protein
VSVTPLPAQNVVAPLAVTTGGGGTRVATVTVCVAVQPLKSVTVTVSWTDAVLVAWNETELLPAVGPSNAPFTIDHTICA